MRERQILDAALEVFSEKGFAAATTAEIAKKAGVAEGTIYNYFPSKRELFIAVIRGFVITVPLLDLIDKIPNADIAVVFRQILKNRFSLIDQGTVFRIPSLMGEIIRDPELQTLWTEQFLQPFLSKMEGIFRVMMASGKFRPMEPAIATRAIGGLILGFLMLTIMEGKASPLNRLSREQVAEALVDFVGIGIINNAREKNDQEGKP